MIMSEDQLSEEKSVEMLAQGNLIKQILIPQYIISVISVRSRLKLERKEASSSVHYDEVGREWEGERI